MSINLARIRDAGVLEKERVVLKVTAADDIGLYAIFAALYLEGSVKAEVAQAFWFPDQAVTRGDTVVLYTKAGSTSKKQNNDGSTSHFFYWERKQSMWTANRAPVLLEISKWSFLPPASG